MSKYILSEIADVIDCEHKTAPKVDSSKYCSVRTTDISNGKIDYENANRVSEGTYIKWTKRATPEPEDIVLAREAPVGEVGWVKDGYKVCLGQRTVLIKVTHSEISKKFLLYHLVNPESKYELRVRSGGSVVAHLNMKDIRNFKLSLPPFPEQKAIAQVLSSLDDKIDLLHRQNKTLEAIAETLFRQWFIEEAEGDWEECEISDLVEFNPKRQLKKGAFAPYLGMTELSTATFNPNSWYEREFSSGTKFLNEDTLLARITPCLENGKTAYITFLENRQVGWGSTEYIVMRPVRQFHPFFAYALARNLDFRAYAEGCLAGSSGRQRIDINHLTNYPIRVPSDKAIQDFNEFAKSIVPKLEFNAIQVRNLEKLRDTLLPKLMSGEVRVKSDKA